MGPPRALQGHLVPWPGWPIPEDCWEALGRGCLWLQPPLMSLTQRVLCGPNHQSGGWSSGAHGKEPCRKWGSLALVVLGTGFVPEQSPRSHIWGPPQSGALLCGHQHRAATVLVEETDRQTLHPQAHKPTTHPVFPRARYCPGL